MALSKVGTGSSFDNGGSSWSTTDLTKDTGTAIGDLAVIIVSFYENGDDANSITTPTGFTDQGTLVVSGTGTGESRVDIFTRVIDGSEAAAFTVARAGVSVDIFGTAQLLTLRGESALSVASVTAGTVGDDVTSVAAPSVSGTSGQGLLAAFSLADPGGTYTPPSGMTLGISESTESTNVGRIYFETLEATGATGTRTLAFTNTRDAIGISILVNGAAADSGVTKTPTNAVLTLSGLVPSTNAFNFVRIRDVLINESGQPVGSQTNLRLLVWYSGQCIGAPDVSLNAQTTDTNGTASWSIPTGSLTKNAPIFYVAQDSLSFSNYTAARMTPSYE